MKVVLWLNLTALLLGISACENKKKKKSEPEVVQPVKPSSLFQEGTWSTNRESATPVLAGQRSSFAVVYQPDSKVLATIAYGVDRSASSCATQLDELDMLENGALSFQFKPEFSGSCNLVFRAFNVETKEEAPRFTVELTVARPDFELTLPTPAVLDVNEDETFSYRFAPVTNPAVNVPTEFKLISSTCEQGWTGFLFDATQGEVTGKPGQPAVGNCQVKVSAKVLDKQVEAILKINVKDVEDQLVWTKAPPTFITLDNGQNLNEVLEAKDQDVTPGTIQYSLRSNGCADYFTESNPLKLVGSTLVGLAAKATPAAGCVVQVTASTTATDGVSADITIRVVNTVPPLVWKTAPATLEAASQEPMKQTFGATAVGGQAIAYTLAPALAGACPKESWTAAPSLRADSGELSLTPAWDGPAECPIAIQATAGGDTINHIVTVKIARAKALLVQGEGLAQGNRVTLEEGQSLSLRYAVELASGVKVPVNPDQVDVRDAASVVTVSADETARGVRLKAEKSGSAELVFTLKGSALSFALNVQVPYKSQFKTWPKDGLATLLVSNPAVETKFFAQLANKSKCFELIEINNSDRYVRVRGCAMASKEVWFERHEGTFELGLGASTFRRTASSCGATDEKTLSELEETLAGLTSPQPTKAPAQRVAYKGATKYFVKGEQDYFAYARRCAVVAVSPNSDPLLQGMCKILGESTQTNQRNGEYEFIQGCFVKSGDSIDFAKTTN